MKKYIESDSDNLRALQSASAMRDSQMADGSVLEDIYRCLAAASRDKAIALALFHARQVLGSVVRWDWWRGDCRTIVVRAFNSKGVERRFRQPLE